MTTSSNCPNSTTIEADRAVVAAMQDVSDYAPTNPACSAAALRELVSNLALAEETELRARRALEVAREQTVEATIRLHNTVLETKVQVMAQYGRNSPLVHAVGLKQKSERKRPARRAPAAQ